LQLGTQEQGRVVWQGPAWPGQDMHWEIQRDVPERQGGGSEQAPAWRSGMRFRFAGLGEVNATVLLHGDRVHVQIETGSGAIGSLLREQAPALSTALDAAGTPLASFDVHTKGLRRG
ncbi:flagellar hook-length control protein FliK, partial [Massilia arenosa]